jgi:hypothetical protein
VSFEYSRSVETDTSIGPRAAPAVRAVRHARMRGGPPGKPPLPRSVMNSPAASFGPRVGAEEAPEDYPFSARIVATMAAMVLETVIGDMRIGL